MNEHSKWLRKRDSIIGCSVPVEECDGAFNAANEIDRLETADAINFGGKR